MKQLFFCNVFLAFLVAFTEEYVVETGKSRARLDPPVAAGGVQISKYGTPPYAITITRLFSGPTQCRYEVADGCVSGYSVGIDVEYPECNIQNMNEFNSVSQARYEAFIITWEKRGGATYFTVTPCTAAQVTTTTSTTLTTTSTTKTTTAAPPSTKTEIQSTESFNIQTIGAGDSSRQPELFQKFTATGMLLLETSAHMTVQGSESDSHAAVSGVKQLEEVVAKLKSSDPELLSRAENTLWKLSLETRPDISRVENSDRAHLYIEYDGISQGYYSLNVQLGSADVNLTLNKNASKGRGIVAALFSFRTTEDKYAECPPAQSLAKKCYIAPENTTYLVIVGWSQPINNTFQEHRLPGNVTYEVQSPSLGSACRAVQKREDEPGNIKKKTLKPICFFFDAETGKVSDRGCVTSSDALTGRVNCKCDHLTVFTVLMAFTFVAIPLGVKITSYVTEAASVFFLLLTVFILGFYSEGDRVPVQISLSMSLIFLHLVSLIHDGIVTHDKACVAFTVINHYFLLASGMWLLVEGVRLFMATSNPMQFQVQNANRRLIIFMVLGWIVPVAIVGVAAAVGFAHDIYIQPRAFFEQCHAFQNYSKPVPKYDRCWLAPNTPIFYSTVIVPLAFVLLINFLIAVKTSHVMFHATKMRRRGEDPDNADALRAAKTFFLLFFMLGGTWILGFFTGAGNEISNEVFMYIHSVVNGLQGFVVFLLYCLWDDDVRVKLLTCILRRR